MKVIDAIMASYEADAIAIRISELADIIHICHAVQGATTFRGDPRTPMELPAEVISATITLPEGDPWERERHLRDMSLTVAAKWEPDALFMVCDGDEIPHPDAVRQAVREYPSVGPRTLRMDYRQWYANWRAPNRWQPPHAHTNQPVIGTLSDFTAVGGPHAIRRAPNEQKWPYCDAVGWHLSNLGDVEFTYRKFGQFAHSEVDNPNDRDMEKLELMRKKRMDCIGRFRLEPTDDHPPTTPPRLLAPA